MIVAVRDDVRRRCGEFCFPPPVTGQRPAKTILAPLVKYEGKRFASADFVRCDPVRYDSGLIKVGSVAPHTRVRKALQCFFYLLFFVVRKALQWQLSCDVWPGQTVE